MSAFGGKADMPFALHMSAFDPKRTSREIVMTLITGIDSQNSRDGSAGLKD
jgi:hypothetical protein